MSGRPGYGLGLGASRCFNAITFLVRRGASVFQRNFEAIKVFQSEHPEMLQQFEADKSDFKPSIQGMKGLVNTGRGDKRFPGGRVHERPPECRGHEGLGSKCGRTRKISSCAQGMAHIRSMLAIVCLLGQARWLGRVRCWRTGRCPLVMVYSSSFVFSVSQIGFFCRSRLSAEFCGPVQHLLRSKHVQGCLQLFGISERVLCSLRYSVEE